MNRVFLKKIFAIVLAAALFLFPVYSSASEETGGIKIFANGVQIETSAEPFIDEGVAMVALRDIAKALGLIVAWEDSSNSIFIVGNMASETNIQNTRPITKIEDLRVIRNVGPFYEKQINNYHIAGRFFDAGIAVTLEADDRAELVLDLNRGYLTLEGYFGVDDSTMNSFGGYTLRILGDDRELFFSGLVRPSDYPRYIPPGRIDLTYINRLVIRIDWEEQEIGDYEQLTAVLANFNFYDK